MINVSPIEYGHVLLVPRVLDNLPQLVDPNTALLALRFAKEADNPYFRVGYNSLGAYATINHLHFQVRVCMSLSLIILGLLELSTLFCLVSDPLV